MTYGSKLGRILTIKVLSIVFTIWLKNPGIGKDDKGIAKGLLGFRVNKHLASYRRIKPEFIGITRILQGSMGFKVGFLEQ